VLDLTLDRRAPVKILDHQVFGSDVAPGDHDLHLAAGEAHSVDIHLNFNAENLGRDPRGQGYWCIGASARPDGRLTVIQLEAPKCAKIVGKGSPPPAH
jgi:hypothetical protein